MSENNRISLEETVKEEYTYIDGLMYIVKVLSGELDTLLEEEGRHFGIMISYLDSINQAFNRIFTEENLQNEEIYQKMLFLYKPRLLKEYRKLCKKRVSRADSLVVIIHRILEFLTEFDDYPNKKELRTIYKIICKIFDNIRNYAKNNKLFYMISEIRCYKEYGYIGKSPLKTISIKDEETLKEKVPLTGSGIRINEDFNNVISEVSWTDD